MLIARSRPRPRTTAPAPRRARRRSPGGVLVTVATLTLLTGTSAGCSSGSDTRDAAAPAPRAEERPTPASAPASSGPVRPATPIATVEGDLPRADAGPVEGTGTNRATLDVLSLQGGERLVTATLRVSMRTTDEGTSFSDVRGYFAARRGERDASGVALLDARSGRRHPVAREPSGACACSRRLVDSLASGESLTMTATFAAPPRGVDRVGLEVPGFGTVPDVPISR